MEMRTGKPINEEECRLRDLGVNAEKNQAVVWCPDLAVGLIVRDVCVAMIIWGDCKK